MFVVFDSNIHDNMLIYQPLDCDSDLAEPYAGKKFLTTKNIPKMQFKFLRSWLGMTEPGEEREERRVEEILKISMAWTRKLLNFSF